MNFNNHSNLEGQHAFLGASKYHWINYGEDKVAEAYRNFLATQKGTVLHAFAAQCIMLNQKLPKSKQTLNMYVNDAIGMKWGVRRSEAQLARTRGHSSKPSDDKNEVAARKVAVKNRRTMSDADLKKRIERLKLEREFKNLTEDDIAPGRKYVSEIISASGKKALTMAAAGAMTYAVKTAMTKEFNLKEAAQYIAANPNKKK